MKIAKRPVLSSGPITEETLERYRSFILDCCNKGVVKGGKLSISYVEFSAYWPNKLPLRFLCNFLKRANVTFSYENVDVLVYGCELQECTVNLFTVDNLIWFIVFCSKLRSTAFTSFDFKCSKKVSASFCKRVDKLISDYNLNSVLSCSQTSNANVLITVCDYIKFLVQPLSLDRVYLMGAVRSIVDLFRIVYHVLLSQLDYEDRSEFILSCVKEVLIDLRYSIA